MPTCKFTKKNSFTYPVSCILPSFSQNALRLLLPKRLWKCAITFSFRESKQKVVLLVIYLFNYDSSKSTSIFHLMLSCIRFCSNELEFFAIQRLQEHCSFCSACVFWYVLLYKNLIVLGALPGIFQGMGGFLEFWNKGTNTKEGLDTLKTAFQMRI